MTIENHLRINTRLDSEIRTATKLMVRHNGDLDAAKKDVSCRLGQAYSPSNKQYWQRVFDTHLDQAKGAWDAEEKIRKHNKKLERQRMEVKEFPEHLARLVKIADDRVESSIKELVGSLSSDNDNYHWHVLNAMSRMPGHVSQHVQMASCWKEINDSITRVAEDMDSGKIEYPACHEKYQLASWQLSVVRAVYEDFLRGLLENRWASRSTNPYYNAQQDDIRDAVSHVCRDLRVHWGEHLGIGVYF